MNGNILKKVWSALLAFALSVSVLMTPLTALATESDPLTVIKQQEENDEGIIVSSSTDSSSEERVHDDDCEHGAEPENGASVVTMATGTSESEGEMEVSAASGIVPFGLVGIPDNANPNDYGAGFSISGYYGTFYKLHSNTSGHKVWWIPVDMPVGSWTNKDVTVMLVAAKPQNHGLKLLQTTLPDGTVINHTDMGGSSSNSTTGTGTGVDTWAIEVKVTENVDFSFTAQCWAGAGPATTTVQVRCIDRTNPAKPVLPSAGDTLDFYNIGIIEATYQDIEGNPSGITDMSGIADDGKILKLWVDGKNPATDTPDYVIQTSQIGTVTPGLYQVQAIAKDKATNETASDVVRLAVNAKQPVITITGNVNQWVNTDVTLNYSVLSKDNMQIASVVQTVNGVDQTIGTGLPGNPNYSGSVVFTHNGALTVNGASMVPISADAVTEAVVAIDKEKPLIDNLPALVKDNGTAANFSTISYFDPLSPGGNFKGAHQFSAKDRSEINPATREIWLYKLDIATNTLATTPLVIDITTNLSKLDDPSVVAPGRYYYDIVAYDYAGNVGYASTLNVVPGTTGTNPGAGKGTEGGNLVGGGGNGSGSGVDGGTNNGNGGGGNDKGMILNNPGPEVTVEPSTNAPTGVTKPNGEVWYKDDLPVDVNGSTFVEIEELNDTDAHNPTELRDDASQIGQIVYNDNFIENNEGYHEYTFEIVDEGGKKKDDTLNFGVDKTKPVFEIDGAGYDGNGKDIADLDLTFTDDPGPGANRSSEIKKDTITVTVTSKDGTVNKVITGKEADVRAELKNLPSGEYKVTDGTGKDWAGNVSDPATGGTTDGTTGYTIGPDGEGTGSNSDEEYFWHENPADDEDDLFSLSIVYDIDYSTNPATHNGLLTSKWVNKDNGDKNVVATYTIKSKLPLTDVTVVTQNTSGDDLLSVVVSPGTPVTYSIDKSKMIYKTDASGEGWYEYTDSFITRNDLLVDLTAVTASGNSKVKGSLVPHIYWMDKASPEIQWPTNTNQTINSWDAPKYATVGIDPLTDTKAIVFSDPKDTWLETYSGIHKEGVTPSNGMGSKAPTYTFYDDNGVSTDDYDTSGNLAPGSGPKNWTDASKTVKAVRALRKIENKVYIEATVYDLAGNKTVRNSETDDNQLKYPIEGGSSIPDDLDNQASKPVLTTVPAEALRGKWNINTPFTFKAAYAAANAVTIRGVRVCNVTSGAMIDEATIASPSGTGITITGAALRTISIDFSAYGTGTYNVFVYNGNMGYQSYKVTVV